MLSLLFSPAARNVFTDPRTPDMRKTKTASQGLTPQKRAQKSTSRSLRPLAHNRTPGAPVLKSTTAKPRPSRKRAARLPRDSSAGPKKRSRAEKQAEDDMVGSVHDPDAIITHHHHPHHYRHHHHPHHHYQVTSHGGKISASRASSTGFAVPGSAEEVVESTTGRQQQKVSRANTEEDSRSEEEQIMLRTKSC